MANNPGTPTHTRRTILKVGGTVAIAGIVSSGSTIAQTDLPLEIEQNAEDEYVIVRSVGDEEVDITGYQINFEAGEDSNQDQIRQLAGEVVIAAGEEVWVATGALEVEGDNVVQLTKPYERPELNNEDPDVIALLDPDGNVVVRSDGTGGGGDGDGDDGDGDGSDDGGGDDSDGDGSDDGDGDGDDSDDGTRDDGDGGDETGDDSDEGDSDEGDGDGGDGGDGDGDDGDDTGGDSDDGTRDDGDDSSGDDAGDSDEKDDSDQDDDCPKR